MLSGQKSPTVFGGSGSSDYFELSISLKNLPPESAEEMRPIFRLIAAIVQKYVEYEIKGKVVTIQDGEECEYTLCL